MASELETLLRHDGLLHEMSGEKLAQLQGEVFNLFLASSRHSGSSLTQFAAAVFPAIHFNQFRVYRDATRPIGWVSWAYMTEEEARGYMAGDFEFKISTWVGGEHFWFIDFIAPYGHALKIAEDIKHNVFPDKVGFAPDLSAPDGTKRVRKFFGADVKGADTKEDHVDFLKGVTD